MQHTLKESSLSESDIYISNSDKPTNNKKRFKSFYSYAAVALMAFVPTSSAFAEGVQTFVKEVTSGLTTTTGGVVIYELKTACNSNTGDCGSLIITDILPAGTTLESCSLPVGYSAVGASCAPGSTAVTINKDAVFGGGDSAVIEIKIRVPLDADPAVDIVNSSTAVVSLPAPGSSGSITAVAPAVDVLPPVADWVHTKDRVTPPPSVDPTWDTDVLYKVQLCANKAAGNVQLTGVSMVDVFPANAVVVNAGGAVVSGGDTLTWTIPDADVSFATLFQNDPNLYETQQCIEKSYTLRYPAVDFPNGTPIDNTISSTNTQAYAPTPANIAENIVNPTPSASPSKYANDVVKPDDLIWHINANLSLSNAPVPDLVVYDTLPSTPLGLATKQITSGQWNSPATTNAPGGSDVRARISYSQTAGLASCADVAAVYTDLTGGNFIASPAAAATYVLPANTTCVRWEFRDNAVDGGGAAGGYKVPLGWQFTTSPLLYQDTTGVADADIDAKVTNCVSATYTLFDNSTGTSGDQCSSANIESATSDVITAKYIYPASGNKPGDLIKIRMRFYHDQADSTGPIINPVVADLLPPELEFVEVGFAGGNPLSGGAETPLGYTNALALAEPAPNYEVIPNFNGSGKTLVRYSWSNAPAATALALDGTAAVANPASFAEGSVVDMVLTARVKAGTPVGNYTNEMQFFDKGPRFSCNEDADGVEATSQTDPNNIDGDAATDKLCYATRGFAVISSAVLDGSKWIKGDPTLSHIDVTNPTLANNAACPNENGGFTRYPCVAQTTKGGNFEYLIKLKNVGNEPLTDYIFYDVLPAIGDTGVGEPLSASPRGTEWKADLIAAISPANQAAIDAGATIEYSTAANSCRPEVSSSANEAGWDGTCTNDWGAAPADLSTVTAFRIILPFNPTPWAIAPDTGAEMHFSVSMKAPLAAPGSDPTNVNDIHPAWNSFAHRVTQNSNGSRLPTAEPKQVGIIIPKGPKVSIGSVVWADTNNNGAQEAGEAGIDGITVNLLYSDGTPAADQDGVLVPSQLTQGGGKYYFDNLDEGDYVVQVSTPVGGYVPSTTQTTADNDDSKGDSNIAGAGVPANTFISGMFTLSDNGEPLDADETSLLPSNGDDADAVDDNNGNMTVDFGFYQPVSIGSIIWNDTDKDGMQDAGELGIANADVQLLDGAGNPVAGVAIQTTSANGSYYFGGLLPGDYKVRVTMPAGYVKSATQTTADNNDTANDSNIATSVGNVHTSGTFTLNAGGEPTAAQEVGGLVIAGNNSDDADNGLEASGNMTVDFGFYKSEVSIGSIIWNDTNNNGLQDAGELGIANADVQLLDGAGNPVVGVATQTTGADGAYYFPTLVEGDYKIRVTMPAGYTKSTTQTVGDNDDTANDSNIAVSAGNVHTSGMFTLIGGSEPTAAQEVGGLVIAGNNSDDADNAKEANGNMTVDFGFYKVVANAVSIGSVVWNDTNNDGIQDSNENGISGAVVTLLDGAGAPVAGIAPVTTGANGLYYFDNLPEGDYQVQVVAPAGFAPSAVQEVNADGNADNDSNIDTANSVGNVHKSGTVTLSNNGEPLDANETGVLGGEQQDVSDDDNGNMTVDFGFYQLNPNAVSIGSLVWFDDNDNGKQDDGEQPLAGATVKLLDGNGVRVPGITEQVTGSDGLYYFDNLPAGNYQIEVTPPAGYEPSAIQNGASNSDITDDSNILSSVGNVHTSGTFNLSVGGEPTEAGGLVVNGNSTDDADNAAETNGNMTVDFGFNQPTPNAMSLGSVIWSDTNMDGIQDAGEPAISGAIVTLLNSNGTPVVGVNPQTTGNDGLYYFGNLPEGSYRVSVTIPAGLNLIPTFVQEANADGDADNDSNIASSSDTVDGGGNVTETVYTSGIVQLSNGNEPLDANENGALGGDTQDTNDANGNMTVDFGFVPKGLLGALSGNVSEDTNGDGLVDNIPNPNDPNNVDKPIEGVTLQLYTAAGQPVLDPVTGQPVTTTTDVNGNYIFENLVPGPYQVREIQPSGFASVSDIDPSDPLNDIIGDGTPIDVPAGGIALGNNFIEIYAPTAVPTLSEWALLLLMMMLGFVGIRQANPRGGVRF